ncbi:MAG: DUF4124 domain-containing protein [bacterium]
MNAPLLHSDRPITLICLLTIAFITWVSPVSAAIYKTTDAQGNVVFTDIPPRDNAQSVELTQGNLYQPALSSPAATPASPDAQAEQDPAADAPSAGYDRIAITSPAHDESLRENTGNINVTVAMDPALDTSAGHRLQVLVDGQVAGEAPGATISLQNVDRGTHTLIAQVIDANNSVLASSDAVVVHLHRYSILNAPGKKPAG